MTDGGRHPTGDGAPDALMEGAVAAVREARGLLDGDIDGLLRSATLRRVTDRLTDIEGLLPADHPARTFVVPQLGALIGLRCTHDGDVDPGEGETALRHLRWADRALPVDHPPAVESRTVLVGLLLGRAVAVAPEPPQANLTEVQEVVERLALAPMSTDFHETTAAVRRRIARSMARPAPDPVADAVPADQACSRMHSVDTNRSHPLEDLVHWRGELPELLQAVRQRQAPSLVVFDRSHVVAALEKTISGLVTLDQLSAWAQAVHFEDEVNIDEAHEDVLTQFLYEVSTPELFGPVTTETRERWLHLMRMSQKAADEA
ncbi:hypothetical protein AB0P37_39735 [Streptomyces antimycoticus]|uniref:hypothetical protein n=1 Tax=Streptomyces antimycoticus TaxID=68175 RepID=UPI0034251795